MTAAQDTGPDPVADSVPERVETLPAIPGLSGLYARGVVASARLAAASRLPGRGSGDLDLPQVVYRVAGVPTGDAAGPGAVGSTEHLARYDDVVGEAPSDVLPAGYLHVLGFPLATALMVRGDFPLPLLGMVHLANSVSVVRPVRLGDSLEVRAWARDLRPHRRGVQVDLVTEISVERTDAERAAGSGLPATTLAYRGVSTYLAKGVRHPDESGRQDTPVTSGPDTFVPPLPTARWSLRPGTGRAYAAVSGDRNPIHTSALGAKAFGFPRAIAHGMYTAARALAEAGPTRGETYDWTVTFAKPVLLPSTVDVAIRPAGGVPAEVRAAVGHVAPAVPDGAADPGSGLTYLAWDRTGRLHLSGSVVPR
ncbi:MaoC/PaaZ C-terminal domain-containing protein [Cellulosimicrobium sp. Marseille-Q4280]|uniref:MaoC/PaaZ C-terminal domain-containing protein n=1 Tax=Cellulosimicrobium sp. Marseille-Q4280 TaxID=2937992 RepID=UPI00203B0F3B|nr:MaoC/PaaZ C-terminal domain-containing protein [Cellulosimicrobium sp. Marseille-Q4280]